MVNSLITEQLKRLPHRPGVYIYRDAVKNILYVGKATDLSHRVRSYFQAPHKLMPKIQRMVSQIADIDFYIASSEQEALIMELNFIKQYRPRYNVMLKDDKTFPYLKINVKEKWARVYVTRRFEQDGGRYFGPFASSTSVKQTLRIIKRLFPLRFCNKDIGGKTLRPCLEYHLGHCLAPCTGDVRPEEYAQVIKEVTLFLEGKRDNVIRELQVKMNLASEAMDFEKAARIRDQIQAMHEVIEGEKVAAVIRGEEDVVAFVQEGDHAFVQVLFVRGNKLTGREGFMMQGTRQEDPVQVMTGFIKQYYSSAAQIPPLLLLQYPVEDRQVIREWLKTKRGAAVDIVVPRRGVKKQLIDIAAENARQGLEQIRIKEITAGASLNVALEELEKEFTLKSPPIRMEAYDISNLQGSSAVGSMVVFEKGKPKSAHYRRFKIKTVEGANDYAMLQEVIRRRFKHSGAKDISAADAWSILPDLVLIDGGKGQLNSVRAVLKELDVEVPLAGLAKENEEIYLPGRTKPLVLPRSSPALQLLQRLRDEAHRFAVSYFTSVHRKKTFASIMDGIPGVGPRRKNALLRQFGSIQRIREASIEELVAAAGVSPAQAKKIKEYL
ncbi:MAG: excinuclease ABC subunit C [Chloroflexi bacterium RBG_13_51_52]|nr:MAG: excinuclease ABC subunit C [Chloroflexi bacterium RBG_13_51_52]